MSEFIINGISVPILDFHMTNNVTLRPLPDTQIKRGSFTVEGEITAYFEVSGERMRRWMGANRNALLRMIRSHMPKRAFYRLRGRVRADARRERQS